MPPMARFDKFPLASPGWPYLIGCGFLAAVATALGVWWLAAPLWLIFAWMAWFFRDPARRAQASPGAVISPADGRVVAVEVVPHAAMPGGQARMISIFMNVFDVHVNRAPAAGRVADVRHIPGGFVRANLPGARLENERVQVVLDTPAGDRLVVNQVAGLVARRIECELAPGDNVQRGQRYGMIRFGSRLDVYLPTRAKVRLSRGQKVRAGVTVIGEL